MASAAPRVALFPTCLVDQLWPEVGAATVRVLRRAGCEVDYDPTVICCGQPAWNTGYRAEAARVARGFIERMSASGCDHVVLPSASCTAMVHHLTQLFPEGDPLHEPARKLVGRTRELATFLVEDLGRTDLGARFDGRVAWHDACHGLRELGIHDAPRQLIAGVRGAELVELGTEESCCGFGGTFSVKLPELSVAMLDQKLEKLKGQDVRAIVSGDVSCLMQIGGRLERSGSRIQAMHLSELLASGDET